MKISVATLILLTSCVLQTASAQFARRAYPAFPGQPNFIMAQGVSPEATLTPGYPLPAPANLQPEVVDGSQSWNAFSPPQAPIPPGSAAPAIGGSPAYGPTGTAPIVNGGVFGGAPLVNGGAFGADPFPGIPGYGVAPTQQTFSPGQIVGQPALPGLTNPQGQPYTAFQSGFGQDPFLNQQQLGNPFGVPQQAGGFTVPGANGPEPYRFGWQQRLNLEWVPDEGVNDGPAEGQFGWFGLDYELQWTQQMPGWIFITVPQFGFRAWDGPRALSLPSAVYHFGYEIRMETPRNAGPYSFQLSFTPSFNSDLEGSSSGDAWNLDGRGAVFFQLDQYWQVALGLQYWDRVNDRILPYGGLIYTDDFWEWRFTFPEARVNLFLGSEYLWAKWLYVRAEYHIEAYEIDTQLAGVTEREQVELRDWRALIGLKMDTGYYDWFFEGGWVFGRDVRFSETPANFDIGTGFIGQIGLRF